jgi:DNA-binding beta-propeller fold protein YncE
MRAIARTLAAVFLACALSSGARAYDMIKFLGNIQAEFSQKIVAVASSGERVYAIDERTGELHVFEEGGKLLRTAAGAGDLSGPKGLAVGPDGNVFVADTKNSRVQVFDPDGKHLRTVGTKGSAPGELSRPVSVAVGADGRVFVSDTGNHRVQVFTAEGIFLFGFGGKGDQEGMFREPGRIEVDPADRVYVLDSGNDRLQVFKADTSFAKSISLHGQDFAVDRFGFIYMLDRKRGKIKELSPKGLVLGNIGTKGRGRGQFKDPRGIAVGPEGELLIADTKNKRVQRIEVQNKLKSVPVQPSLVTKLLVTGPTRSLPAAASAIAAAEGKTVVYDSKAGDFAVFDAEGKEARRFGTNKGKEDSVTKRAGKIALSAKHGLYVTDEKGDRIQNFSLEGEHKLNFGVKKGLFGNKEGSVDSPTGIAINEKGSVYIADTGDRRVEAYGPDGMFLFGFGPLLGPYELSEPVGVAWDPAGFLYVLDRKLKKVFKCEPSGGYIKSWGEDGAGIGQFEDPVALAYDGRSYLYVLDQGLQRVSVFDGDGNWVTNFFAGGEDERSLDDPSDLAVLGSTLMIADSGKERVVSFRLHPQLAPPVAVSTKAVEGLVKLRWEPVQDQLASRYRVYRSTRAAGGFREVGATKQPLFEESEVEANRTYYYRVAVEADTGDVGPRSRSVAVFIPAAFNKSPVEISTVTAASLFSSNYKWYGKNSFGKAVIVNNKDVPFRNVKFSFQIKNYMDFPADKTIPLLKPKESVEIELFATLNNRILEITEDTPILAEFSVTYFRNDAEQKFSMTAPVNVYSRNAITWQDPRRIANYITQRDTPVLDLTREILRVAPKGPPGTEYLNENLTTAMRLWAALGALGVKFLPSPNNPFETMSEDPAYPVDYTQFPRETLRRRSGECDDLVTLTAAMLEGATVRTAVIDYPGHLALMFDTGSNDPMEIGLSAERMIEFEGTYWIPLEATMVGKSFEDATRKAVFAYNDMKKDGRAKIIDPRKAWEEFEPATLPASNQKLPTIELPVVAKAFGKVAKHYLERRYAFKSEELKKAMADAEDSIEFLNRLGILDSQHGRYNEAKKRFEKALEMDAGDAAALNNLGSLAFVREKYEEAMRRYAEASEHDPEDPGVWMNLVRTALKLGDREKAEAYSKRAIEADAGVSESVDALLKL